MVCPGKDEMEEVLFLHALINPQELFPRNSRLCADAPQGRTIMFRVIRHRERRRCAVRTVANKRNVVTRPYDYKPERLQRLQHLPLGRIVRKLHLNSDFGNEGLHDVVVLERIVPEGFYMELYGRFHFGKGLFVGIPLGNDDTLQPQRVSDIAVRVLLDDDLQDFHLFGQGDPLRKRGGEELPPPYCFCVLESIHCVLAH